MLPSRTKRLMTVGCGHLIMSTLSEITTATFFVYLLLLMTIVTDQSNKNFLTEQSLKNIEQQIPRESFPKSELQQN